MIGISLSPSVRSAPVAPLARALAAALGVVAVAGPAGAQVITGTLVEETTGAPVDGAMISAVDSLERTRDATLTDRDGDFRLDGLAAGRYVLRADRIGHESSYSDTLTLADSDTARVRMTARVEAVRLAGIEVEGERRCMVRPSQGEATARIWEEARKALAAAAWTRQQQPYRFRVVTYIRRLDETAEIVEEDRSEYTDAWSRKPFRSLDADLLAERGFMERTENQGTTWFAPDAEVLLSDPFLDTHCFAAEPGRRQNAGLIGLRFEPVEGREVEEIRGTMWLDAETAELRWLEYDYVNLDLHIPTEGLGGRVEFDRVPGGGWIVNKWWIRMPVIHLRPAGMSGFTLRPVLGGYLQEGGQVLEVRDREGRVVLVTETGAVQGSVAADEGGDRLEGARIWVPGSGAEATSDEEGRFAFAELGEGSYEILWSHPRLDSLGIPSVIDQVRVRRGEVTEVELVAPSRSAYLERRCSAELEERPPGAGILVGRVVSPQGTPLPDASVTIGWDGRGAWALAAGDTAAFGAGTRLRRDEGDRWTAEVVTDGHGYFLTCVVPAGEFLDVHAQVGPHSTDTLRVRIPADRARAYRTLQVRGEGTIINVPDVLRPRPDTGRVNPGG